MFRLVLTRLAAEQLEPSKSDPAKLRRVRRCLGLLETNPKHPGLRSHKYTSLRAPQGQDVWESYVENNTPAAWRVFWHYGPGEGIITIVAITPHP